MAVKKPLVLGSSGHPEELQSADNLAADLAGISFQLGGPGATISTGVQGYIVVPFDCTITEVYLVAGQTGSIVVDLWVDTYANHPPTGADSICASAKPTISSSNKSNDSTLTGWTTSLTKGKIMVVNVDSVSGITNCAGMLMVKK
jgi:hypothetical protein